VLVLANDLHAGGSQFVLAVLGAEIRIDDIKVGYGHILAFLPQMQGVVYGDVGLSAPEMPAE